VLGVTEINSIGGYVKEYQIAPNPQRLASLGVSMENLVAAIDQNNHNAGAGYIEKRGEQYLVRAPGQVRTLEDIRNVVVKNAGGIPVRVRDVADVGIGQELRTGAATANGKEVVLGTVFMLMGQNSRTVSQAVDLKMQEINRNAGLNNALKASRSFRELEREVNKIEKPQEKKPADLSNEINY
jgi:cobalt-zinc-cadmium resistance protein CzcA